MATELVWAVMMVKDEADVIATTIEHLLASAVDGVLVADNLSTDGTMDILYELARRHGSERVFVKVDAEPAYYQAEKTTALAQFAHKALGATWILPCDADEIFYSWSERALGDELRAIEAEVLGVPLWNHYATGQDRAGATPFERMVWRTETRGTLDKMTYRWRADRTIGQGAHRIHDLSGNVMPAVGGRIGIRHFPYRNAEHFVRKAQNGYAAYQKTDLPEYVGAHWRQYGALIETRGVQAGRDWWLEHFYYAEPAAAGLVYDPAPVQRRER